MKQFSLILILIAIYSFGSFAKLTEDQKEFVEQTEELGFLKIYKNKNEAHVNQMFWDKMNKELRIKSVTAWAQYIGEHESIIVYSKSTGKKLAKYDILKGYQEL